MHFWKDGHDAFLLPLPGLPMWTLQGKNTIQPKRSGSLQVYSGPCVKSHKWLSTVKSPMSWGGLEKGLKLQLDGDHRNNISIEKNS